MDIADLKKLLNAREADERLASHLSLLRVFSHLFFHSAPAKESPAPVAAATSTAPDAFANVPLQAKAAIVYDLSTGKMSVCKKSMHNCHSLR